MNNSGNALELRAVAHAYEAGGRSIPVLRDVTAALPEGACISIQGASGAGKSTLLHILGGLEKPSEGVIACRNESIYDWHDAQRAQWRNTQIGFVFQAYHLLPELTAVENIDLPARLAGKPNAEEALKLLWSVGLEARASHLPGMLSGGEQQRVAIARALRNQPRILLADEPTGNLDRATGTEIWRLLRSLQKERGATLIVVTHDAGIAAEADARFCLDEGKLVPQS